MNFVLDVFDCEVLDEIIMVEFDELLCVVWDFVVKEGLLVGMLFGVVVVVVLKVVVCFENVGKIIVVVILDIGECYFFIVLFEDLCEV